MKNGSEAWAIFKKFAPHHPEPENISLYLELLEKLKQKNNFQIARYNDGEWIWMLQIKPYYMRYLVNYGGNKLEVDKISKKLLKIIDSIPSYYIGVGSTTRAGKGITAAAKDIIDKKLEKLDNLTYGDIFNAATIKEGIDPLINALLDRNIITVGPDYMSKLGLSARHISVPAKNCWEAADQVKLELDNHLSEDVVVLYACSLLAKYLIDINHQKYGDTISQLDLGSCIDPWCGVTSRPWHRAML